MWLSLPASCVPVSSVGATCAAGFLVWSVKMATLSVASDLCVRITERLSFVSALAWARARRRRAHCRSLEGLGHG